jgi:hypothetical protein
MQSCPVFPVVGTVTAVGSIRLDRGGVLYRYIRADGPQRVDFDAIRAYVQQLGCRA